MDEERWVKEQPKFAKGLSADQGKPSATQLAYLDGYENAMHHASWALDEGLPNVKHLFPFLRPKKLRKAVRKAMLEQREGMAVQRKKDGLA